MKYRNENNYKQKKIVITISYKVNNGYITNSIYLLTLIPIKYAPDLPTYLHQH